MKALPPLGSLRQNLSIKLHDVRQSRFFHDRLTVILLVTALIVGGLNLILLLGSVHPSSLPGAVRYSSLDLGYTLGPWYYPYVVAFFGLGVTLVNGGLAYRAFTRSRLTSFYLLTGSVVVSLFCLIISNALGVVR